MRRRDDDDDEYREEDDDEEYDVSATSSRRKRSKGGGRGRSSNDDGGKSKLPDRAVRILKNWLLSPEHVDYPYPTPEEKDALIAQCGITPKQLSNWLVNARKRIWAPLRRRQGKPIVPFAKAKAAKRFEELEAIAHQQHEQKAVEAPVLSSRRSSGRGGGRVSVSSCVSGVGGVGGGGGGGGGGGAAPSSGLSALTTAAATAHDPVLRASLMSVEREVEATVSSSAISMETDAAALLHRLRDSIQIANATGTMPDIHSIRSQLASLAAELQSRRQALSSLSRTLTVQEQALLSASTQLNSTASTDISSLLSNLSSYLALSRGTPS